MGEIIARFADGRLLVQEERALPSHYSSGGVAVRIGHVKTVEKVLSIDVYLSGNPCERIAAPLNEVLISGDTIIPILRRADLGSLGLSGVCASGPMAAFDHLSGITSGLLYMGELLSGGFTSGEVKILANVIGF